jgi:hypothetical protein
LSNSSFEAVPFPLQQSHASLMTTASPPHYLRGNITSRAARMRADILV